MTINLRFLPEIPEGMWVMEADIEVAGIQHHKANALAFARRKEHSLELDPEPRNRHDPNAIRVIGISKGWFFWRRHFLGYVPKDTAKMIADENLGDEVLPRLKNIWVGGYVRDVVYIRFDILKPKPAKQPPAKRGRKAK